MKRKLLFAALCVVGALGFKAQAQVEPTNGNAYYIYNEANDLFFTRGAAWGTQAYASPMGIPWRVEVNNGSYTFKMYDIYTQNTADTGLGFNGEYTDNGSPIAFTLEGNATNGYTLKYGNDYLTCPTGKGVPTLSSTASVWKFLTQAQYDAVLAARATENELAVATSKGITIPSGQTLTDVVTNTDEWASTLTNDGVPTKATWPITGNADRKGAYNEGTYGVELFQTNSATISKTISGLNSGIYKVSVRGMKRMGTNEGSVSMKNAGFYVSDAYVNVNGSIIPVKAWASDNTANDAPNGPAAVVTIIGNGGYTTEGYAYVGTDGNLTVNVVNEAFWWGGWMVFNGISYTYYTNEVSTEDATTILTTASTLESQEMDATIKSTLTSAKNTFDGTRTIANYNALQTAITAAQASADAYALFAPERTKALALGMSPETIAAVAPNVNALKVAEYNFVKETYPYGVSLGTWTSTGQNTEAADFDNEHWSGTTHQYKNQKDGTNPNQGWQASSWSIEFNQNVSLPAGNYVFKVAGRQAGGNIETSLVVKQGETTLGTVSDFPRSNSSRGINKSGETAFEGDNDNFANDGKGFGWEWRYVKFTLDDPAVVNIAVNSVASESHQWVSFGDYTLQTDDEDNVEIMEALVELNNAKTAATLTKNTSNVGTGVFQYNESTNNSLWSAYETAKSNAESYTLTSTSTVSEVNTLATALNNAISNYKNQALNAPDASKRYTLTIVQDDKDWNGNAVTFIAGARTSETPGGEMGGYGIQYLAPTNANLNQALKFTAVEGQVNTYKISAINVADGGERYITTGSTYEGGNNAQIRTTDDASKASWVKIQATATEGQFQLLNVSDGNKVIANNNNNDMYTANSANFTIAEASQATVGVSVAAGKYATRIFPFTPTLPTGVVAYSCAAVNNETLTLVAVEEPAANVPYILYSENGVSETNLTDWGTAAATSYTVDLLTGVYTNAPVPAGKYVLQTQEGKQGFYEVGDEEEFTAIPNRAYLTLPSGGSANVRALFFPAAGEATGIEAIGVLTSGNYDGIYTAGGAKVNSLQKGLNIVVKDGKSYKIFVK